MAKKKVHDWMHKSGISCRRDMLMDEVAKTMETPETGIDEAVRRLHEKRIHRLVVVEESADHARP